MSNTFRMLAVRRLALGCALALCSTSVLRAQEVQPAAADPSDAAAPGDGASAVELDAVVVTGRSGASRRTRAETSYSLTDIDEERLRLQAPTSVTEAMKSVPGFWVEASGGEASGNIRARGVPVDGFGSVSILEDGMPVQHDPALGWLNGDQAFRLDETIERIEVVRGGPSSVFYSNAPAGVINFIPREVGAEAGGVYKLTVGDDGLRRFDFYTGVPLGGGWKAWMGGFWRGQDGVRDPGFKANDGGQLRAGFGRDFDNGGFSFDWKHLDDRVALYLGIPMRREGGQIRPVPGVDGNHGTLAGPETEHLQMLMADGSLYDFDNSLGTHVVRDQYTAKFQYGPEDGWQFRDSLRYSVTDTQRNGVFGNQVYGIPAFLDQAATLLGDRLTSIPGYAGLQLRYVTDPSRAVDPLTQNGNGLMIVGGLRAVTPKVNELANDARLVRRFEFGQQSHDLTFGYYYARFDQDFDRYSSSVLLDVRDQARLLDLVAVDADGNPLRSITDQGFWQYGYEWENASGRSTTHAFYVADEWQVNERLRIDAGVRHERVGTEGWVEIRQPASDQGTWPTSQMLTGSGIFLDYDESFDKTGWTVGANWQFTPRSGLFARWTSAFRLPNLSSFITRNSNCSPADLEACLANNTAPIPQTMDLGEVGFKFSDQAFDLFATVFYTQYDNVGFSDTRFDLNGNRVTSRGEASTRTVGLELEAGWFPTPLFDLQLTATVQEPEYRDLRYSEIVDGQPVLRDFVGNQLIRVPKHSLRLVPGLNLLGDRLRLQLAYEYQGERYVDTANSVRLPSYDVWSASARYQVNDQWSVFLYGDNLDNSLGLTEGNPRAGELQSGDAGANTFLARPLLGRQYRAAVMYKF